MPFTDDELNRLNEASLAGNAATPFYGYSVGTIRALLVRLLLAEEKDCNQYHCGHQTCNAWRKAAGK